MESRIPFMFSSVVTAEELDESFIDTSHLSIYGFAVLWSEADLQASPEEAEKLLRFDELEDGCKYISFLSRPLVPLDADSDFFNQVFLVDHKYLQSGLLNYVAMLSRMINSAPGGDSNWPYGRYFLREIDGIRKIIGKTHCLVDGSLNVTYSLTQHDIGNIRFILVPVYNDFSSGQISISNELLVHSVE